MKIVQLEVLKRERTRKSELKNLRKNGFVPGIIYGEGLKDNILISVPRNKIRSLISLKREEDFLVEVKVKEREEKFIALLTDEQYHPVTDEVIHVDFHSVSLEKPIVSKVPIHFIGEPIGVKEGGVLIKALYEIEIEAKPLDMPSFIEINIGDLKIGDSIHISELKIKENLKVLHDPNETIVTVSTPTVEEIKVEEEVIEEGVETKASEEKEPQQEKKEEEK